MAWRVLRIALLGLLVSGAGVPALPAQTTDEPAAGEQPSAEQMAVELKYQQGVVELPGGLATLKLPPELRYLDAQQTQFVLEKMWGNPPDSDVLGMIFPTDFGPEDEECWGVVISYDDSGHIDDADAASIDYNDLLRSMQDQTRQHNVDRTAQGYDTVELIGWAEPPHYDGVTKKLYWAKDLEFGGEDDHTLNYCVRVLGRHGYLELNAVATMQQLPTINKNMPQVISAVDFNPGNRYADFNPSTDRMAEFGIAALIAGGVAAKTGLLKGLIAALIAAKKLVVVAVVAVFAFLAKLFGFRKKDSAG